MKHATSIASLKPKICLTCWEVFTTETELYHSDNVTHKTTNEFSRMGEANKETIVGLAKAHSFLNAEEGF